ncbi:hypothetical protein [Raineya orbicola]|uniref:Cytochrome C n=1 Tax=Raineya orbicola TaxID=2016530 RepID=A0A2N3IIC8_9BACT|nr:hypothetical protein [Raineya orbicola]PKQ70064.1 hypothetical protein Rain11_0868 [Raineya orbicola]
MQKNIFLFGLVFIWGAFLMCCQKQQENTQKVTQTENKATQNLSITPKPKLNYAKYTDSTLYPNGGSELAVLMREMYDDMDSIKKLVLKGELPTDLKEKFAYLHNATPTDNDTKQENYPDMAKAFMDNLNRFYEEKDKKKRIQLYKVVVQTCISCHQTHCTGVVKKIKKLEIQD